MSENHAGLVAWGYYRISEVKNDGDAAKPQRQASIMDKVLDKFEITHARRYIDSDLSAWDPDKAHKRVGFNELITDIEAGPERPHFLSCYHWDRMTRNMGDANRLIQVCQKYRIKVIAPQGIRDPNQPDDEFMMWMNTLLAKRESDDKSRRLTDAHNSAAENGQPFRGGWRPFGLAEDRVTPHPTEALIVRELAEWVLTGVGYRECARRLNQRGITTTTGRQFEKESIKKLLSRPSLIGFVSSRKHPTRTVNRLRYPDGAEVEETVLDETTWRTLQAVMGAGPAPVPRNPETFPLSGLLYCGNHGAGMRGPRMRGKSLKRSGDPYRIYACDNVRGSCGVGIVADHVEQIVPRMIVRLLSDAEFLHQMNTQAAGQDRAIATLEQNRATVRSALDRHAENIDLLLSDPRSHELQRQALARRLQEIEESLGHIAVTPRRAERMEALKLAEAQKVWNNASLSERIELARRVCLGVLILPSRFRGGVFDDERIKLLPLDAIAA